MPSVRTALPHIWHFLLYMSEFKQWVPSIDRPRAPNEYIVGGEEIRETSWHRQCVPICLLSAARCPGLAYTYLYLFVSYVCPVRPGLPYGMVLRVCCMHALVWHAPMSIQLWHSNTQNRPWTQMPHISLRLPTFVYFS